MAPGAIVSIENNDFDFIHDYIHGRSCKKFSSLYLKSCWLIIARRNKNAHTGIFCNDNVSLIDIPITECMLDKKVFDLAINRDDLGGLRFTVFTKCFMSWPQLTSTWHTPELYGYGRRWCVSTESQSLFLPWWRHDMKPWWRHQMETFFA